MPDEAERLRAADPATPQEDLAQLAYTQPELRSLIAANPATYDGLLEWLGQFEDPELQRVLASRRGVELTVVVPTAVEPTSAVPTAAVPTAAEPMVSTPKRLRIPRKAVIAGTAAALVIVVVAAIWIPTAMNQASGETEASDAAPVARHTEPESSPSTTPSPVQTVAPVIPSIVASGFTKVWQQGFTSDGGYTETVALSIGLPQHVGASYPRQVSTGICSQYQSGSSGACASYQTQAFIAGKKCSNDKAADAVIAIDSSKISTTVNFPSNISESLTFGYSPTSSNSYLGMTRVLQYEASYSSSGIGCTTASYGVLSESSHSTDPAQSGDRVSTPIFLFVPNYYTPDHPNGDPAVLAGITVSIGGGSYGGMSWTSDNQGITYQLVGTAPVTLPATSTIRLG